VKEGETLPALAAAIGVPADAFVAAINTYNQAVETKNDAEFKRPDMPRALKTPKYYPSSTVIGIF